MNRLHDHQRTLAKGKIEGGDALDGLALLDADDSGASETKSQREEEERLLFRRAMDLMQAEFEEKTWQAFWQVIVDGRSPADVGGDLGMTANAVYLARGRVLRRLREEFADLIDLDPPAPRRTTIPRRARRRRLEVSVNRPPLRRGGPASLPQAKPLGLAYSTLWRISMANPPVITFPPADPDGNTTYSPEPLEVLTL